MLIQKRYYSHDQRKQMAGSGAALPDGSFPIRDATDLKNAISLMHMGKNPEAAKAHIIRRAGALGLTSKLPETWGATGAKKYESILKFNRNHDPKTGRFASGKEGGAAPAAVPTDTALTQHARRRRRHRRQSTHREFTPEQRTELATTGNALPDGSFPIRDAIDLRNAVRLAGRARNPTVARQHIIRMAGVLGLQGKLPASWATRKEDAVRQFSKVLKFNPNHDPATGRFTTGPSGGGDKGGSGVGRGGHFVRTRQPARSGEDYGKVKPGFADDAPFGDNKKPVRPDSNLGLPNGPALPGQQGIGKPSGKYGEFMRSSVDPKFSLPAKDKSNDKGFTAPGKDRSNDTGFSRRLNVRPPNAQRISQATPIIPEIIADRYAPDRTQANKFGRWANKQFRTDPEFAHNVMRRGNAGRDWLYRQAREYFRRKKADPSYGEVAE